MTHSLADFEQRRQAIAQQVAQLGDLRAGSITISTAGSRPAGKSAGLPNRHFYVAHPR
jgi:hypothetical protein